MNTIDKDGLGVSLIQSNFHGIGSRIGEEVLDFSYTTEDVDLI